MRTLCFYVFLFLFIKLLTYFSTLDSDSVVAVQEADTEQGTEAAAAEEKQYKNDYSFFFFTYLLIPQRRD